MVLEVNKKQFEAVVALPAKERYGHFIKRVADAEEAWGLRSEGGWALAADEQNEVFPLWPHPQYAQACAAGDWAASSPERLSLGEVMDLLGRLEENQLGVAVFPTPQGKGIVVSPAELRRHLEAELENY